MGGPANPAQIRTGSLKLAALDSSGKKDLLNIPTYGPIKGVVTKRKWQRSTGGVLDGCSCFSRAVSVKCSGNPCHSARSLMRCIIGSHFALRAHLHVFMTNVHLEDSLYSVHVYTLHRNLRCKFKLCNAFAIVPHENINDDDDDPVDNSTLINARHLLH